MKPKTLFMETTEVPHEKTAGEIISLLVQSGARQIGMDYDQGKLTGLKFVLEVRPGFPRPFALPARVEPVFKILNGRRKYTYDRTSNATKDRLQAERVAWRQLLRWVQAQVAMIQTGMVEPAEVFLPYAMADDGRTFWELATAPGGQLALPPAPETVVQFERK